MSTSFNFSSLATTQATSSAQPRLKPWGIYNVKFAGARKEVIQGRKDPNATYEILKVRFEGEEGYYEESIFYPKAGDDTRPTYTSKEGHEYQGASSFERTMTFIAQVATVLNPEGFKKMQAASSKFKSFDDVVTAFIKITDVAKGKETKLKLIGKTQNNSVVASLPKFIAVNKKGEAFVCDNFIGEKVYFDDKEEARRSEYLNAKPTSMEETQSPISEEIDHTSAGSEDIDFESLL